MQQFGKVRIEHDKVITPNGQIPFNADSTVRAIYIKGPKYAKKAVGVGLFVAACLTGGAGLLLTGPAVGFWVHESHRVILNTDGEDFLVEEFKGIFNNPQEAAIQLQDAISNAITNLR
ncbi:MAG: hypothetical protein NTV08_11840 [Verrucomicrobia bacterium]|nr:hypothetical protein [Verrucomicrobiota bacterium]